MLKREYDSVIQSLSANYRSIFLCDLAHGTYKAIKLVEEFRPLIDAHAGFEELLRGYVEQDVAPQYRQRMLDLVENGGVAEKLALGEPQVEVYYRNARNGWRKVKVVPSGQYSLERPIVVVAFSEQDREVERGIGELRRKSPCLRFIRWWSAWTRARGSTPASTTRERCWNWGDTGRWRICGGSCPAKCRRRTKESCKRYLIRPNTRASGIGTGHSALWIRTARCTITAITPP